jgi:hypothetical protein
MDQRVVVRCRLGEKTSMADYVAILDARARMIAEFARQVPEGTLLVSPTLPHVAPPIARLIADDELFFAMNGKTLRNTLIGNFLEERRCGHAGRTAAVRPAAFRRASSQCSTCRRRHHKGLT